MSPASRLWARAAGTVRHDLDHVPRWAALDGLRGVAIVAVVAYHSLGLLLPGPGGWARRGWPWWWMGTGRLAVDVLFVLSGFLVVRSWHAARSRAAGPGAAARDFFGRRARRILPVYAVSLVFAFVVLRLRVPGATFRLHEIATFATLQQHLVRGLPGSLNLPTWSLTTEVHFYLLVPLLAVVMARVRSRFVVAGCIVLTLAYLHGTWRGDLPGSTILGRLDQFAVGAAAAAVIAATSRRARGPAPLSQRITAPRVFGALAVVALVVLGFAEGLVLARRPDHLAAAAVHPLTGLVAAGLVLHLCWGRAPAWLSSRPARFLGMISYSAYLLHYPIVRWGLDREGPLGWGLTRTGPVGGTLGAVAVVAVLGATIVAVSVACYLLVERPFIRTRFAPAGGGDRPSAAGGREDPSAQPPGPGCGSTASDDRSPAANGARRLTSVS